MNNYVSTDDNLGQNFISCKSYMKKYNNINVYNLGVHLLKHAKKYDTQTCLYKIWRKFSLSTGAGTEHFCRKFYPIIKCTLQVPN
jgi:hypothetical protein